MSYKLDREAKALAIKLAMEIECDDRNVEEVLDCMCSNKDVAEALINFWLNCNDMTRSALYKVTKLQTIRDLESCLNLQAKDYPIIEH